MTNHTLNLAIVMATEMHDMAVDKGGQPYILHPLRVMLSMAPDDMVGRIAAVLHDTVEDTALDLATIRFYFLDEVADAVDALSRRTLDTGAKEPYTQFIARLAQNEIAVRVKLMDIADNMRPERYHESITGLHGRYEKARDFLTAALLEFQSTPTANFLLHTKMITPEQYIKRIAPLRLR